MLVVMPVDYFKLCDSNDSAFGVYISSRFPVSSKSIELLSFSSPILGQEREPEKRVDIFGFETHRLDYD
ncbi:hypothetical protein Tco_0590656 [Tanacetum coccineum]